jgi:hypothetical protein
LYEFDAGEHDSGVLAEEAARSGLVAGLAEV